MLGDPGSIPGLVDPTTRRKWQPTPVSLPGKFHGQRGLVRYSPWVPKSRTWLSFYIVVGGSQSVRISQPCLTVEHTGSRTSPERLVWIVWSLKIRYATDAASTKVYQPKVWRLGMTRLFPWLFSQGWSYSHDSSWSPYGFQEGYTEKLHLRQYSVLFDSSKRRKIPRAWADCLAPGEEVWCSCPCLSLDKAQIEASAFHSGQEERVKFQSGQGEYFENEDSLVFLNPP